MNCKESQSLFADYLGSELPEGQSGEFKQHIKNCPQCSNELASLTKTCSLLQVGWPEEPIPQHLVYELPRSSSRSGWLRWWQPGAPRFVMASLTLTGCLILCAGSLSLFRTQIRIGQGGFQVSFGQSVQPSLQPSAVTPVRLGSDTRDLQPLVDRALQQIEQKQDQRLEAALLRLKAGFQERRDADMRRIANELRQLESTQNVVYRQAVSSNTYLETLARDFVLKANLPAQLVH
jgi:hypothetical protein